MNMGKKGHVKVDPDFAQVIMNYGKVQVMMGSGDIYTIMSLGERSRQFILMEYLMRPSKQRETQFLEFIPEFKKIKPTINLSEVVRKCGFDDELKRAFFTTCENDQVYFEPSTFLDWRQIRSLKKQAEAYENKF